MQNYVKSHEYLNISLHVYFLGPHEKGGFFKGSKVDDFGDKYEKGADRVWERTVSNGYRKLARCFLFTVEGTYGV